MDQFAHYLFELRGNIVIEGDLELARLEIEAVLSAPVDPIDSVENLFDEVPVLRLIPGRAGQGASARTTSAVGFHGRGRLDRFPSLVRKLAFVQYVYAWFPTIDGGHEIQRAFVDAVGPIVGGASDDDHQVLYAVPHYALFELGEAVARHSTSHREVGPKLDDLRRALLGETDAAPAIALARRALAVRSTIASLTHNLHYYKAKFFPRLARSLLNVCTARLDGAPHRVIDNFVGSGTTLLEAATLGIPSVGIDIDPLSVLIANTKILALEVDPLILEIEVCRAIEMLRSRLPGRFERAEEAEPARSADNTITFPAWLMKNRRMSQAIASALSREIHALRAVVAAADPAVRDLFRVHLSDAIARHVRMRLLGTGVGRFSLSFSSAPLSVIFARNLERSVRVAAVVKWLRETLKLRLADAKAVVADARRIPDGLGKFDMLLTSPPYLPASSGRESYAKARALSLIALGVGSRDEVDDLIDDAVGSMDGSGVDFRDLSERERDVVEWLRADELRAIKAAPTARYFLDMRQAFAEMHRVLVPGAVAVVVSGKQSTFYRFATRETLYVVPAAEILAEEAERTGFEVQALHHVQLHKANRNARPRSLDDYYETLIVLRRPG